MKFTKALSVARAKDREAMADRIEHIVKQTGSQVARNLEMSTGRVIWLEIRAPRGLSVTIDLDGDDRQQRDGIYVLAWHIRGISEASLTDAFGLVAGGSVNQFHRRKCTAVNYSFEPMCRAIEQALAMADDGSAFEFEERAAA